MHAPDRRPAVSSALSYCDPKGALRWLEQAFGLEPYMVILDADSNLAHSEMRFGDGVVMIGSEWSENHRSPASLQGKNTQTVHLHLSPEMGEIDAHCARARQAGARILREPETQFYGDRVYSAVDPEGHIWTFGQTVKAMTSEEWDKASGLKTLSRLP